MHALPAHSTMPSGNLMLQCCLSFACSPVRSPILTTTRSVSPRSPASELESRARSQPLACSPRFTPPVCSAGGEERPQLGVPTAWWSVERGSAARGAARCLARPLPHWLALVAVHLNAAPRRWSRQELAAVTAGVKPLSNRRARREAGSDDSDSFCDGAVMRRVQAYCWAERGVEMRGPSPLSRGWVTASRTAATSRAEHAGCSGVRGGVGVRSGEWGRAVGVGSGARYGPVDTKFVAAAMLSRSGRRATPLPTIAGAQPRRRPRRSS
eukprot:353241-Chlamydomonas_euryale.AAC.7